LANYVTVVDDRPIMSAKYCLPVPVFHVWPKLTHPAARSLCDSWATCYYSLMRSAHRATPLFSTTTGYTLCRWAAISATAELLLRFISLNINQTISTVPCCSDWAGWSTLPDDIRHPGDGVVQYGVHAAALHCFPSQRCDLVPAGCNWTIVYLSAHNPVRISAKLVSK